MTEGRVEHKEASPTAASAGNPLFSSSGVITYRVLLAGAGVAGVDVDAASGDEAADMALAQYPGAKVTHVAPAPQKLKKAA